MIDELDALVKAIDDARPLARELSDVRDKIVKAKAALSALEFQVDSLKTQAQELRENVGKERHLTLKSHQDEVYKRQAELQELVTNIAEAKAQLAAAHNDLAKTKEQNTKLALVNQRMERISA